VPTPHLRLLPAVLSGTVVTAAQASRAPSTGTRAAITAAVHTSSVGGLDRIPKREYRVTDARISSVSSSWASAQLTATRASRSTFQSGSVILVRLAGTNRWVVLDVGSAQVGCGIAPDKVLADLDHVQRPCSTGGIS
jgi:hypothetical protein